VGQEWKSVDPDELKQTSLKEQTIRELKNLTSIQKQKLFWQISGIILGAGNLTTLTINFIISQSMSWAKYNLVASLALFAIISAFVFLRGRPVGKMTVAVLVLMGMLFVNDQISHAVWGTKLAVPIVLSCYILLLIIFLLIHVSNQLGFNILAVIFLALGLFLLSIEGALSLYFYSEIKISWSGIAAASLIPVAAVLFFVHYKLKKGSELKRFFHI
jgi:hypothetical protein